MNADVAAGHRDVVKGEGKDWVRIHGRKEETGTRYGWYVDDLCL
jgi:hypothetical protein